jgi:hypothetical protein
MKGLGQSGHSGRATTTTTTTTLASWSFPAFGKRHYMYCLKNSWEATEFIMRKRVVALFSYF